jgi:hypothetical protein
MKIIYQDMWDQEGTRYSLVVIEDEAFLDMYGGRFLVVAMIGSYGTSYFYNKGYKDPSYVFVKHPNLSFRDAEIIAERLNGVIG